MLKDSETFFRRTLEQNTAEVREAVDKCIKYYLSTDSTQRKAAARSAFMVVDRMFLLLHENDRPAWLNTLHDDLQIAEKHSENERGIIAMQRITSELYPQVLLQKWNTGTSESASGVDFDSIYEKYRSEFRIPELFDELIRQLKKIVESDAIDSITALRDLNKIISTLQNAQKGSYFATRGAWIFLATWLNNTGWELLGSIPVAGNIVKGLRKTIEETTVQMKTMDDSIQVEIKKKFTSHIPRLEDLRPIIPAIKVPKNGDLDPIPESAK